MKLVSCTGRTYEVRDAGPVLARLRARSGGPPIKPCGDRLLDDAAARAELRELIGADLYDRVAPE